MLHVAGNANPAPRNDFIFNLTHFVQEKRSINPLAVNINLNANKQMGEELEGLQWLTAILGPADVHGNKLGSNAPATCTRGSKQIDCGLARSGLPHAFRTLQIISATSAARNQVHQELSNCWRKLD